MRVWLALSFAALLPASLPVLAADAPDGVKLMINEGPGPDEVTLAWAGGHPTFEVFRSEDPADITSSQ